jgi:tetratricopeptide (TPR) repeat protein
MTPENNQHRWKKNIVLAIVVFAALLGASYLVYEQLQSGRLPPIALLILAAVISVAIPIIRPNLFPSNKDCESEYLFHEQRLEKKIITGVHGALGPGAYGRIFAPFGDYRESADEAIKEHLASDAVGRDPDLHFALLIMLARFYEKRGDPQTAIKKLQAALKIKPQHFIARMHLAGNYEWVGKDPKAGLEYAQILEHPEVLSKAMRKLVTAKLKAVTHT